MLALLYSLFTQTVCDVSSSFDFDEIVDRSGTSSTKHEKYAGRDVLPLWVADMDFRAPPSVIDALRRRIDHGVYGYTDTPPELIELIRSRLQQLYGWQVDARHIVFLPGVVPALNVACRAYCDPGDPVITSVPIYPPFMSAPAFSGRELLKVPARCDDGVWSIDLDGLEQAAASSSLLLLCNPYNPVGRALTRDELAAIADICERHDVVICSDEIHCDLLFDGRSHIPTATLGDAVARRTVTLMAPSKTFNLAGFGGSFAVIQDDTLRRRFKAEMRGIMPHVGFIAYEAMIAAYRDGEPWYDALITYLQGNRDFLAAAIAGIPGLSVNHVEATYLAWLDVSALGLNDPPAYFEQAGVGMSEGYRFDDDRFMRLNFGCPRSVLEEAVVRLDAAARGAR